MANLILMYHRIGDPGIDPWSLAVTPDHFAEQLDALVAVADVVPLHAITDTRPAGRPRIAITFDDGYADNLATALPLLERRGLPATVFITTDQVGSSAEFWWDELERLLLDGHDRPMALHLDDGHHWVDLAEAGPDLGDWRWDEPPPSRRAATYLQLWEWLRPMSAEAREPLLAALRRWAGDSPAVARPSHRTLRLAELRTLAAHPLIEIGGHTRTHPLLTTCGPEGQATELLGCHGWLEEALGGPVRCCSYPYGARNATTLELLTHAGIAMACTTDPTPLRADADPLQLPRMQVIDLDGERFAQALAAWIA